MHSLQRSRGPKQCMCLMGFSLSGQGANHGPHHLKMACDLRTERCLLAALGARHEDQIEPSRSANSEH